MRILVTGGFGFTGKYTVDHLIQSGHQAIALQSDLTRIDAIEKEIHEFSPESVIHLAGISSVRHNNCDDFYKTNLIGSRNLLATLASSKQKISSICMASSALVYGNKGGDAIKEDSDIIPGNEYGVSKYAMELMAHLWDDLLPIVITRPFNYTGRGQTTNFIIPKIVQHFRDKEPTISLGNTHQFREFGDVRDVVEIYHNLLENPPVGETVNICTSQPHKLRDVINICSKITGHEIDVQTNPEFVRENEPDKLIGNDEKLMTFIPSLKRKTLEETLAWMLS